jgi:hypothetical protein
VSKASTIAGLIAARERIFSPAQALAAEKLDEIFLGTWSTRDLLAHLVGWDYANIDSVNDIRAGKSPRVFQHWNPDWRSFNAKLVKEYKRADRDEMFRTLRVSHRALIKCLKQVPAGDFEKDFGVRSPRGRIITIAEHLQSEIDDEVKHYSQLQDWLNH